MIKTYFSYKNDNITSAQVDNLVRRMSIGNYTDLESFKQAIDPYYGNLIQWKFNEASASKVYDVSGQGNNGTITGATWQDDGINNSLTVDVDYNYTDNIFQILNSEYAWSNLSLSYLYVSNDQAAIDINETIVGIATFSDFWEVIILALVISIVIGLLIGVFGSGRGR